MIKCSIVGKRKICDFQFKFHPAFHLKINFNISMPVSCSMYISLAFCYPKNTWNTSISATHLALMKLCHYQQPPPYPQNVCSIAPDTPKSMQLMLILNKYTFRIPNEAYSCSMQIKIREGERRHTHS